jgi:hypothetical protein
MHWYHRFIVITLQRSSEESKPRERIWKAVLYLAAFVYRMFCLYDKLCELIEKLFGGTGT